MKYLIDAAPRINRDNRVINVEIEVFIDLLEKGITMTMSYWEFQSFVQNLEMANFKISKVKEIEIEESCDCDKCVEKRKGQ